jgi:hypothetical protein
MMVSGQVYTITSSNPDAAKAPELVWIFSRKKALGTVRN